MTAICTKRLHSSNELSLCERFWNKHAFCVLSLEQSTTSESFLPNVVFYKASLLYPIYDRLAHCEGYYASLLTPFLRKSTTTTEMLSLLPLAKAARKSTLEATRQADSAEADLSLALLKQRFTSSHAS